MINYPNTPGVKIDEVSTLPPSVVQVATSIPVFLGYTAKNPGGDALRVRSLKEYEDAFGGPFQHKYAITASASAVTTTPITVSSVATPSVGTYYLYEAMQAYFLNGGGPCYILSVGSHTEAVEAADFITGLDKVARSDEPTLIVMPEAASLGTTAYGTVITKALLTAELLEDKFVILDTPKGQDMLTAANLSAYRSSTGTDALNRGAAYFPHLETVYAYQFDESSTYNGSTLLSLKNSGSGNYGVAMSILKSTGKVTLPPSAMMAGLYATSDRSRGVWKAPANMSLQGVVKPVTAVSDSTQEGLNVDATTGKSINVIRSFTGQGTLVWGARTLAGNDNEWRYINVRRLFLTVEESVKKAMVPFVFESNDAKTWVKVRAMIQSYLRGVWQDGGLQGVTEKEAFFVQVGLGQTMSELDILEGKMIVEVGIAAVRPAEFIILRFQHYTESASL
ncbi:MAG: phage tail sheath C-terminal domain-containing protein [Bacteroidota bacterium]